MRRPDAGRAATALIAVVALVLGAILVSVSLVTDVGARRGTASGLDLHGNAVRLDPGVPAPPVAVVESHDAGARLRVPSVGLDVPLAAVDAVDGRITPPGFDSAYRVRNVGVAVDDAAEGTVYVVTHSMRGAGVAPGNHLIDVAHQGSAVAVGASVVVDGTPFSVTQTRVVAKSDLAADRDVWASTANRLVLITCLQRPDGAASTHNLVITASRAASS